MSFVKLLFHTLPITFQLTFEGSTFLAVKLSWVEETHESLGFPSKVL